MNVNGHLRRFTSLVLFFLGVTGGLSAQDQSQTQPDAQSAYTLKVNSDLVLTNVVVRDKKTGEVVRGLKASDFQVLENGKPQSIISFDFQSVDQAAPLNEATINGKAPNNIMGSMNRNVTSEQLPDTGKQRGTSIASSRARRRATCRYKIPPNTNW